MPPPPLLPSLSALCAAMLLSFPVAAQHSGSSNVFCCRPPPTHQRYCGDTLPKECYGHEYHIISPAGTIVRTVAASSSPTKASGDTAAAKEEEARIRAQERADAALLATYSNVEEIDSREQRDLSEITRVLQDMRQRSSELEKQVASLNEEIKNSADDDPIDLKSQREATQNELATYQRLIEVKEQEEQKVRNSFSRQRERFIFLKQQAAQ